MISDREYRLVGSLVFRDLFTRSIKRVTSVFFLGGGGSTEGQARDDDTWRTKNT